MIKIKSLFQRNYEGNRQVRDELVEGSEWVANGEGYATRKWDGQAVRLKDTVLYVRYDAKTGRTPPPNFEPAIPVPDPNTGHWPGWVPVDGKNRQRIEKALVVVNGVVSSITIVDVIEHKLQGAVETYEFCGPTVGTRHGPNPENLSCHILVPHGEHILSDCPRDFEGLKQYLTDNIIEGVVWYHPDGRLVKIKAADFGIRKG